MQKLLVASIAAAMTVLSTAGPGASAQTADQSAATATGKSKTQLMKEHVKEERKKLEERMGVTLSVTRTTRTDAAALLAPAPLGFQDYSIPNYANSPLLTKFVDPLPGLCSGADAPGTCIPIATKKTAPSGVPGDGDYYEIGLRDYTQKMHGELAPTHLRGYYDMNGTHPNSYLGPIIVAEKGRPVRIKFTNKLTMDGKHILPVDTTVMGAGPYETGDLAGTTTVGNFGENRAGIHLHGGFTPWISDGTPHQWVSPQGEAGDYEKGMSTRDVPDMPVTGPGEETLYYPNQQSSRLMFYHDHAYGITRLNVYAGEAAGYIIHDPVEDALITAGTLPNLGGVYRWGVPLIIQDKSFVHTGTYTTDPTWADVAPNSQAGDLWFPHVYVPNQDPNFYYSTTGPDGMNAMGRWDYGPWIWPPAAVQVPDTLPNPSIVPEAFMDTMVVNGKAFPYMTVERKAYRFRVLNASNDRYLNLQLYYAFDDAAQGNQLVRPCNGGQNKKSLCSEVAMVPRNGTTYTYTPPGENTEVTYAVPDDGFRGSVPDPRYGGPKMLQIGNEGGFLPAAVVRNAPAIPVTYDTDPKSMTVGNVQAGTIILGPAERADIVVDFSGVADNAKLILYNDAPAAFPASDPRYDYFTGNDDLTANGGAPPTQPGVGPNTRTVMQFRVTGRTPAPAFNFAKLSSAIPVAYADSQDPPLIPEPAYNVGVWNGSFPSTPNYATLFNTTSFTFTKGDGTTETLPIFQKAIAEEFDVAYGRMTAVLGTEAQISNNQGQNTFGFAYVDPSTENLPAGVTQIWKITHNGVDTHAIHWHLVNVQVINRVDWAGVIKPPDPDELGWKETLRMNPLEDIIIAVQAKAPTLPFPIADSVRPKDVTQPIGSQMGFTQPWPYVHTNPLRQPEEFPTETQDPVNTVNEMTNFGWEYVWHCHLLGHEEADMMRPLVMTQVGATGTADTVPPTVTAAVSPAPNAAGWNKMDATVTLTATDNPGGAGVASITYSGTNVLGSTTSFAVATEGTTTISYYATDSATPANSSTPATLVVRLDKTAPSFSVGPTATVVNGGQMKVTVAGVATDGTVPPPSGLVTGAGAGTYVMTGPSPANGTFSIKADGSFSFTRTKLKGGSYNVTVSVKDNAGNTLPSAIAFTIP
jgi:FtsP/CotA-like multicopper oxidase with cupredoxin domain